MNHTDRHVRTLLGGHAGWQEPDLVPKNQKVSRLFTGLFGTVPFGKLPEVPTHTAKGLVHGVGDASFEDAQGFEAAVAVVDQLVEQARTAGLRTRLVSCCSRPPSPVDCVESALEGEISDHLGYDKGDPVGGPVEVRSHATARAASSRRWCGEAERDLELHSRMENTNTVLSLSHRSAG